MAWYSLLTYVPPTTSGTGANGTVAGGWTDVGSVWRPANLGGGASDNVVQTSSNSPSPWTNAHLVRAATSENAQNVKVRYRWQIASGATGAAPFVFLRYVKNSTDAQANGLAVKTGQLYPISAGALGTPMNGTGAIVNGSWYDTEVTATTNGSSTTITETTTNVTNHVTDAFGTGTSVSTNTYTTSIYPAVSGGVGVFSYQPGTLNIQQFNTFSDVPATALVLSPAASSASAGTASTFTVSPNGAQNGGTVSLSDGGAGGSFSPASITLSPGTSSTASFSYTPVSGSSGTAVTLSATASGLTSTTIAGTASVTVQGASATALSMSPNSQNVAPGATSGPYTVGVNGALSSPVTVSLTASISGGTFNPSSITLTQSSPTATFSYTPSSSAPSGTVSLIASSPGFTQASASASVTATATALALSPGSQVATAGTASPPYSISANGTIGSPITVTLSDAGSGGTFAPTTATLTSSAPTASFTYTPSTTASGGMTLTASANGLTSATAAVTAVQPNALLTPSNASVVMSPYNWVTGLANTSVAGNTAARCWNPGAYIRCYVTGCTSVAILFGVSTTAATFTYQIDDGIPVAPVACVSNNGYVIALPDTGTHSLTWTLSSLPQSTGRWSGTNAVVINGFQPGSGGAAATAVIGRRRLLIYGDSIAEGIQSRDGADGVTTSFAYHLGESFRRQGWEYGIKAAAGSGYAVSVSSSGGGQPQAWTSGNDAASSWNKVDGSGVAGAALTTGGVGTASERFVLAPDLIVDALGTNDGLQSVSDSALQPVVQGLMQRLRVAAPNAIIVNAMPFGGYKRNVIQAAVSAANDPRTLLLDTKTDSRMTANGYCGNIVNGTAGSQAVHPWSLGSAILGNYLAGLVQTAYVPYATARSFGGVS